MFYTDGSNAKDFIENDIELLKSEYEEYYNILIQGELSPINILMCSTLTNEKNNAFEKFLLLYKDRIIVLKKVNGNISKHAIEYNDINYIVIEGLPKPVCLNLYYKEEGRERIFFDSFAEEIMDRLVKELRKLIIHGRVTEETVNLFENNSDEREYIGKALTTQALFKNQVSVCELYQKRVYDRYWSIFRKVSTQTHYSIVSNSEMVVFKEKFEPMDDKDICGDLIFIPLTSVKNVSLESTDKGMVLKYMFYTTKTFELFYQNEKTDELLKAMSYINGVIQA
ncbi:hypothetical protein Cpap_2475 [Ruminiclostridium papyrosolvens DSM 2782]|uniref:Uncharacterized protein n=1 Tax=Ruminiclostridium papyrosolvens DSM 2782 TaxID=588581 RepID=F1TBB9_9FIRM|nr:hypothetical protein [Ruminiclostridium papyrosolvens]EGD48323.1 hypothetical protein Cpap_2475 [Ruminiclostridium papyrosolvens DSM 2782]WES34172.1 hypothetical protein P0092_20820 [Ruminiclostridium papyrosolvens DSM 2782]